MSDPFAPNSHDQLIREAQRGLAIVAILLAVLAYVVFDRFTSRHRQLPEHVRNAPIAKTVWPYANEAPDSATRHANRQLDRARQAEDQQTAEADQGFPPKPWRLNSVERVEPAQFQYDLESKSATANELAPQPVQKAQPLALAAASASDFAPLPNAPLPNNRLPLVTNKKPFPHTSSSTPTPNSSKPDRQVVPDTSQFEPRQRETNEIAESNRPDSPLDPFEQSEPIEISDQLAATKPTARPDEAKSTPSGHFVPEGSYFEPDSAPPTNLKSTQDFSAINSLTVRESKGNARIQEPNLVAPRPLDLPIDTSVSSVGYESNNAFASSNGIEVSVVPETDQQVSSSTASVLHQVTDGESYYSIAQHHYGDGKFFRALSQYNQIKRRVPEELLVGTEIEIPALQQLEKELPQEFSTRPASALPSATFVSALNVKSKTERTNPHASSGSNSNSSSDFSPTAGLTKNQNNSLSQKSFDAETNYVTKQGETLFEIAANELGQASRYLEIMEANRESLPDEVNDSTPLPENLKLYIPE